MCVWRARLRAAITRRRVAEFIITPYHPPQVDAARFQCVVSSALISRLMSTFAACVFCLCADAGAQNRERSIDITGDRLSSFVIPIEPIRSDTQCRSLRAWSWTVDDTKRLFLRGDVKIHIGTYTFNAENAVVWINRIPSAEGLINQIAMYFDSVSDPTKQAGLGAGGNQLLVTASTRGEVTLDVALMQEGQPPHKAMLQQAEKRLAEYLKSLLAPPPALQNRPQLTVPQREPEFVPQPGGAVREPPAELPAAVATPHTQRRAPWLAGPQGSLRLSAQHLEITRGKEENIITAAGEIVVELSSDNHSEPQLTLAAERAVIFADPGPLADSGSQFDAEKVRGVYLEGNVTVLTHDGRYSVRAPRVYYDLRTQQAIMVDSLLRVHPRDVRVPLFARATEMRQLSATQWQAKDVRVSTSDFHTPHLAIGAERAVITREPGEEGQPDRTIVDSRHNTVRLVDVPIMYWPHFKGDADRIPIRSVTVGSRSNDGVRILTTWDVFSLVGAQQPEGVEADLKLDAFTKRGAAIGHELRYDVGDSEGRVDLYGLFDEGIDRTSSGRNVDPNQNFRGVALFENQSKLSDYWTMQLQGAIISDETFITTWREDDFAERREYETSAYLKHQRENAALTFLTKYSLQDFISNSYLLASRQYMVDKVPEVTYRRYGDSLFGDVFTYSTENRVTRMSLAFVEQAPNQLGVPGAAFGIGGNVPVSDALFAAGLREKWVNRVDSRHELSLPLKPGIFNVTPFVVGRFTGYDDDFEEFSSDDETMRFYGAAGVRVNTQFQRVYNSVENQLFDLHRLRHIIEPYLTVWGGYASIEQEDLPIYDEQVESLANGAAVAVGLRNTWQTQRGGPGNWRSVDWLVLDTSLVIDGEGEPNESPTPQFFDYRPEYSQFGDHVHVTGIWLLSDHFTIAGDTTYVLDDPDFARGSIGIEMRHTPLLATYIEYRYIMAQSELLDVGWRYQITPKYNIHFSPQWDFVADRFRSVSLRITRSFPEFDLIFIVRYDDIRDDTLFGASLGIARF
jgi:lipopolysaccharide export system protein LptA